MRTKNIFSSFCLFAGCVLAAVTLQGCKDESEEMRTFMSAPGALPTQVIKVENGAVSEEILPDKCIRLVYCYGNGECYPCLVSHIYELCNLFGREEYATVILLCPPEDEMEVVVNLVKAARYDFPIYFPADGERESFRRDILPRIKYKYFLLGDDDRPRSIGDPVRDEDAYIRFMKALQ